MKQITASEMGKKGYKARVKKYGKKYFDKHAEMMRNAKQNKKASNLLAKERVELST